MRRPVFSFLATGFVLCCTSLTVRAGETDPLRLIPEAADLVVKVEQPRALAEMFLQLIPQKELQGFKNYREFTSATNFRRVMQLVGYLERELGKPWPEILDELAGNGIALAVKFDKDAAPALLIVQGRNPEFSKRFWKVAGEILEQELTRQEAKQALERKSKGDVHTLKIGDDIHAALLGSTLIISNKAKGLEAAYALHEGKTKETILGKKALIEGRQIVGEGALAWAWINMEPAHKNPEFKNLYELPSSFFPIPLLFGGLSNTLWRSKYVMASIRKDGADPVISVRFPAGREGLNEALAGHAPSADTPGLRPLLEPPGVLLSATYHHDIPKFWEQREKILPKDQLEGLNKAEKNSAAFLFGTRFGDIMSCFGARHRLVAVRQEKTAYSTPAQNPIPAFAWVVEARDPEKFVKSIEPPIRSINLLTGAFVRMDPIEEMHGGHKIIGYRFAEQQKTGKIDTAFGGVLPNFSPCFVRVGDQIIFSSTIELAHTLIDVLEKESKAGTLANKDATVRGQFYWSGLASFLAGNRDALTTQSILAEGSTAEEAGQQVTLLLELLNKLGRLELAVDMGKDRYHLDLRARVGEKK